MSLLRYINDHNRGTDSLNRIINYVTRKEQGSNAALLYGIGINPYKAYEQMLLGKRLYHQDGGKQYQHLVLSHDSDMDCATWALQIAIETMEFYEGKYQALIATHTDTANIHSHIILNTVNMLSGKKLNQNALVCRQLRRRFNDILHKYGLNPVGLYDCAYIDVQEEWDFNIEEDWSDEDDDYENEQSYLTEIIVREFALHSCHRPVSFRDPEKDFGDLLETYNEFRKRI